MWCFFQIVNYEQIFGRSRNDWILRFNCIDIMLIIRSGQAWSGQVRSGQVSSGQVSSGQIKSYQVRSDQVM